MKTKVFTAWTELVEKFLKDISTETVLYDDLSEWIDTEGPKIFQSSQAEYFNKNKAKYLQDTGGYPPSVKIDLAYEQIAYGFDKIFDGLTNKFLSLKTDCTNDKYTIFKNECLGETFLPFIAARAMITGLMVKANELDRVKNFESTIKAFELLEVAAKASIESMNQYRPNIQSTIPRESSSPLLYKVKQEIVPNGNNNNSHTPDNSMVSEISESKNTI